MSYYQDYREAGFRIFGLHYITPEGECSCAKEDCPAAGKHPVASNWQSTPDWSDDQLEVMEMTDQFKTGFGVLVQDALVVDVDARNGGHDSFTKLCEATGLNLLEHCKFAVMTGSGGGSMHLYFKAPLQAMVQGHPDYKGIDFKSSGFVVGATSLHKSGSYYEVIHGHPTDMEEAPPELLALLSKPDHHRAEFQGETLDLTDHDLRHMLSFISPDCEHETWYRCGMAIHHTTQGDGFEIWDDWSSQGSKYHKGECLNRWHSFGKGGNPVTIGTLIFHAQAGGWQESVTFNPSVQFDDVEEVGLEANGGDPFATKGVDLLRPPGFVGEVVAWMNSQCRFKRENLVVGSALAAMGNICGLGYTDDVDNVTANLLVMGVAGSGTGKEAVMDAALKLHRAAGLAAAVHGAIKSEKEIYGNLIRHQAAFYIIDELGIALSKITNAAKNGTAYHEGTIGTIMSAFTKGNSFLLLNGDTKEDVRKMLQAELAGLRKALEDNEDEGGRLERRKPQLIKMLDSIDNGLERPFLSLNGFTTPETFTHLVTPEQVKSGFFGRAMIFQDNENNPRAKPKFKAPPMPTGMDLRLRDLYRRGSFDPELRRVECYGERFQINTEPEAVKWLDAVAEWSWSEAEKHKAITGYEAIPRRAREMVSKISLILACPSGVRTVEHIRWAFALVKRDVERKAMLAWANEHEEASPKVAIQARVMNLLEGGHTESHGVIRNKCKRWPARDVDAVIDDLEKSGRIRKVTLKHPVNGKDIIKFEAAGDE